MAVPASAGAETVAHGATGAQFVTEQHETFFTDPRTWVGLAFVLFFVFFGRKIWAASVKILDARTEAIRAELDEAARLRREAEQMLRDARTRREAALADADALLQAARGEASRVAASAREDAEAAARRREKMALDRIAAAEKAAVDEVRIAAAEVAAEAAGQLIAERLSPEADARIMDQAIAHLPAALAGRRAA